MWAIENSQGSWILCKRKVMIGSSHKMSTQEKLIISLLHKYGHMRCHRVTRYSASAKNDKRMLAHEI
jgi:hypothetical protein